MNNFGLIIENKSWLFYSQKKRLLFLIMLNWTENKNEQKIKFFNFCSRFISLIDVEQDP